MLRIWKNSDKTGKSILIDWNIMKYLDIQNPVMLAAINIYGHL